MRRLATAAPLLASLLAAPALAADPTFPDVKGTWSGTSETVVIGRTEHHHHEKEDVVRLRNVQFVMTVKGQEGRRFWGDITSPHSSAPFAAVFESDGKTIRLANSQGHMTLRYEGGRMEGCYTSAQEKAVVAACNTYTRQP